jgi:opacity protein-like surface antigen
MTLLMCIDFKRVEGDMLLRVLITMLALCACDAIAKVEEPRRLYLELGLGSSLNLSKQHGPEFSIAESKTKARSATLTSLAFGYKYSEQVRFDLNVSYMPKSRITVNDRGAPSYYHADLSSLVAMINGYYDFPNLPQTKLKPYVMGGMGVSRNEVSDIDVYVRAPLELVSKLYGNSNYNLSWKAGGGLSCAVHDRLTLNIGYAFVSLGRVGTKTSNYINTHSQIESRLFDADGSLKFTRLFSHQFVLGMRINI